MTRTLPLAALVATFGFVSSQAEGAWLSPCVAARLMDSWQREGFWRTPKIYDPPASRVGARLRYVGKIHSGDRTYKIYFDVSDDPGYQHRHWDTVVTAADGKFLGFYDAEAEPIAIRGPDILFKVRKEDGDRIHFGPKGPPAKAWIDGENPEFATVADIGGAPKNIRPERRRARLRASCRR